MGKLIHKDRVVAWIEREIDSLERNSGCSGIFGETQMAVYDKLLSFLDTLEVKEANEALRTEYEKGRADVIADTLSWLENCWPRYCSNHTIIEGFKEAIKGE